LLSAKKFHALGVLAFLWNSLSTRTEWLHDVLYSGTPNYKAGASARMNGQLMTDRVRGAPTLPDLPAHLRDGVLLCADAMDVCRDNRNALLHASVVLGTGMRVSTGTRNKPQGQTVVVKVGQIRRVCHEISQAASFANVVMLAVEMFRKDGKLFEEDELRLQDGFRLPDRLALWTPSEDSFWRVDG
jgi:hypothetical protein